MVIKCTSNELVKKCTTEHYELPIVLNIFFLLLTYSHRRAVNVSCLSIYKFSLLRHWKKMKDISGIVPVITQKNNKLSSSLFLSLFFSMRYVGI